MKILLDDHHGIGDVAMFLCVLYEVKRKYPEAEIHMIIKSPVEQNLVETVGGVTQFFYYDPLNHSMKSILQLVISLRKQRYDLAITHIGTNGKFGSMLFWAAGCKKTIGSTTGKKIPNYSVPIDTSSQPFRARKNALLLSGLGITEVKETGLLSDIAFHGTITKEIINRFGSKKKIGICIGTGNTVVGGKSFNGKKWPDQYWLKLIDRFVNAGYAVIILGGNKEKKERDNKFNLIETNDVLDFVGSHKLYESLEAINNCDLLIAGDTGLGFCSALMDIPTLSLLGPSDPLLAAPYGKNAEYIFLSLDCSPCYGTERMRDCDNRKCMNQITVDMVFEKSIQMLEMAKNNQ